MKRRVITVLILLVLLPINVYALNIDNKNELTIEKGKNENINLTTNVEQEVSEIRFTLVYTSYDIPAYFNIASGLTDSNPNGIAHKIVFSEPVSGEIELGTINVKVVNNPTIKNGTITLHSASAITTDGSVITLDSQTINVTIGTKVDNNEEVKKEITKNMLDKIDSSLVKIELKDDVYEYSVKIKEDIKELDLKPIAKDSNYKVEISTQKIDELKDNKIIIKVSNGDNNEEYIINVKQIKSEEVKIDKSENKVEFKYKSKWIVMIVILSLVLFVGLMMIKKKK